MTGGATGIDKRPEPTVDTRTTGGGDPKPPDPGPRETKTVTPPPPPPPTLAEIGEREILQWIKAYQAAYTQLDEATIRQMNPASSFSRSTIRRASVTFAEIDITVAADGQSAALHAFVTYQSEFVRGGRDPKPSRIVWNMRKIGGRWIANPGR